MDKKGFAVSSSITALSLAIVGTIYLAWILYPLEIRHLQLEKIVYLDSHTIFYNFTILMKYLTNPFEWHLAMPNFSSSKDGLHHFQDVKYLFHTVQVLCLVGFSVTIAYAQKSKFKGFNRLTENVYKWMVLLPIAILGIGIMIGFDQFFILFHHLLFPGDNTWLFNPNTDPVIYILPQEFFLHCFILFFILYELLFLSLFVFYRKKQSSNKGIVSGRQPYRNRS